MVIPEDKKPMQDSCNRFL